MRALGPATLPAGTRGRHAQQVTGLHGSDGTQGFGHERDEVHKGVARRNQNNHAELSARQVLLMFEVPVSGHEHLETGCVSGGE